MPNNYTVYHLHSDLSNGVTNVDSVTKYGEYISRAKECGMKALAFSEHGSIFEWYHKKTEIEAAGMKYIHAIECYLTATLEEKIRDNMHCVLLAKDYCGFLELNRLVTASFNRKDNHFYYVPRISMDELFGTSEHILMTTACVGGVLGKGEQAVQDRLVAFMTAHPDRCFLEIGHHADPKQLEYNKKLLELHNRAGLRLIAGTDTHVLDEVHEKGRSILQKAKNIHFDGEERWDLKFKTYDELIDAYRLQNCLPKEVYLEAIENTNLLADLVEPFEIDTGTKYPHIYEDPERVFRNKTEAAIETHPYLLKNHSRDEVNEIVEKEMDVYKATKSIDFMLLQTYLREWEKKRGIQCGYGRGSVSGSLIAYILGITQMDSARFGLNFFRFMNPSRVTNADIDTDYSGKDREVVKQFLLRDKMGLDNIKSAEIITFNTIATKGAIRDVCRALYKDSGSVDYMALSNEISKAVELNEEEARWKWPEVFRYADIVSGTIVSVGTHPSGVLISDLPIEESIGLCSVSSSDYPVSMVNMKELDAMMYVKLDVLGLDNIGIINDTCKELGIERLTPDNTNLDDEAVWKSIRDDTTLIFQWESNSSQQYLKKFMSDKTVEIAKKNIPGFSMIKWLSFGNGLIRPACASFRDAVAKGEFYDNGFRELNNFLAPEAGRIAMQETIMQFLVRFCGYSDAESDTVRRGIAKKKGTEKLLPEIERRFIEYAPQHYDITPEKCRDVIGPFLKIIIDASAYAFSWNHSDSYSCIGYISGYLRYYHPLEFLTAALNIFADDTDKTANIIKYAGKRGIAVTLPKWGISRRNYTYNKERNVIAKGLESIKYMSAKLSDELYDLSQNNHYGFFMDLLSDLDNKTSIDTRQLDILIKLDFFSDFGNQRELLRLADLYYNTFNRGAVKKIKKDLVDGTPLGAIVAKYATGTVKSGGQAKSYTILDIESILREAEQAVKAAHMEDLGTLAKVRNFADVMGYAGYVSGLEEDRRKLYVSDVFEAKRRSDGRVFGYNVLTKSVGSGKESRFTVFSNLYKTDPIKKGDVIYCKSFERDGQYFTLRAYDHILT